MKKVIIIIPAFNEADNIEKVVNNIIKNYNQYDYIIINMDQVMIQKRFVKIMVIILLVYL